MRYIRPTCPTLPVATLALTALMALMALLPPVLTGQTTPTTITDTIRNPIAGGIFSGDVDIRPSSYMTCGAASYVPVPVRIRVTVSGSFSTTLVPNSQCTPATTYYIVQFTDMIRNTRWTENWVVPVSASPVTISAIRANVPVGSGTTISPSQITSGGASFGQGMVFNGTNWAPGTVAAEATWGAIIGTLSNQTDLNSVLAGKEPTIGVLGLAKGGTNNASWTPDRCVKVSADGTKLEPAPDECGTGGGGVTAHSALTQLDYASSGHTGFEATISAGTTAQYWRGDKSWQTLGALGTAAYPGAGVPNSTGSAWGTSYTVGTSANNLVQLNGTAQLPAVSGANLTSLTSTQVGLGNVENTALSTWAGSSSITALGTVTSGSFPYANLAGVPSTFAPSAHATSHQHSGADEISTATPGANAIPKSGAGGTLAAGWIPILNQNTTGTSAGLASQYIDWNASSGGNSIANKPSTFAPTTHATSHQHGGGDEVATATPGANAIPKAGAGGTIDTGWVPTLNQNTTGTSAGLTAQYIDWSAGSGGASIANKPTLGAMSSGAYPGAGIAVSTGSAWGTSLTAPTGSIVGAGQANTFTTGLQDFAAAGLKAPSSTTLPGTCAVGQIYFDTDATLGQQFYGCTSTDTWTLMGDGTGSGSFGETSLAGLANSQTIWDSASASRTLTAGLSGATDPVITFGNNLVNVSTGVLQVGGNAVLDTTYTGSANITTLGTVTSGSFPYANLAGVPSTFAPSAHATSHQNGGADEVATATPAANAIPKAGAGGTLNASWIPTLNQNTTGNAATAAALTADGANCTGEVALGVDASGVCQGTATPTLGTAGSIAGSVAFANATSGTITVQPTTGALGTSVLTLPASTGTVATTASNITGTAAGLTSQYIDWNSGSGGNSIANKPSAFTPSSHASTHQNGGGDEVATATPAANAIPKAGAGGTLNASWIPTLNQNTTGTASAITGSITLANTPLTTRGDLLVANTATPVLDRLAKGTQYQVLTGGASDLTWGAVALDQASAVSGILGAANGGTGNGFAAFTGPTTSTKTFTLPDASATILTTNALVTGAQGGTGNGFFAVTGPTTTLRTFTFPNSDATILYSGGPGGTPSSLTLTNATGLPQSGVTNLTTDLGNKQPLDAALTALAGGSDFVAFSGPTTSTKTFTLPDASSTLLYSGGPLGTPSSATLTNATGLPTGGLVDGAVTTAKLATAHKTRSQSIVIFDPVTGDSGRAQFMLPTAGTITRVACSVKAATSVTINLDKRAATTPDTAGTDALSAGLVCDTNQQTSCASGCDVNTITSAAIGSRIPVALTISAVSGTPDTLRVFVEYTVD